MPITLSCALFGPLFLLFPLVSRGTFLFFSFNELVFFAASGGIHLF